MDGFKKKRLNASVQLKLSAALFTAIVVVALLAGALSFMAAYDEARELQDDVLRQVAQLLDRQRLTPGPGLPDAHIKERDDASRVIVQRLGQADPSPRQGDDGGTLALPGTLADGFHSLESGGEAFRVLVRTTALGERIAVAQEADFRDELARDSALRTVLPFLVLVPVLLLIVADLVRKMFRPIAELSQEIDRRPEQALHPVEAGQVPAEVRPFVVAINRLLGRVAQSMDQQRRFVADAAHELRSPLAALSLQAERLAQAKMSEPARERLATLHGGIERGRKLLEQLLTLARAQSDSEAPRLPVSVQAIYRRVLEDLMPLAEARCIDIGVEGTQDARVWAGELDLYTLVRNLADNAIRYTPPGGRVDLSVDSESGQAVLRIRDTGPGIAPSERERVFEPFYRALGSGQTGSGLGLSIVDAIGQRIGARIRLDFCDEARQAGLCVVVFIPPNAPPTGPR